MVTSDALLLARTPRHLVQLVLTACLPVLALAVPQPSGTLTAGALVIASWAAALASADGARQGQFNAALDAQLPLSQRAVRRCRLVVPVLVVAAWSLPVLAAAAARYPGGGGWLLLVVLAAPVWAAAAVRAAYRSPPDYGGPMLSTPVGPVSPQVVAALVHGPDLAVVGAVPVVIALVTGGTHPLLLAAQAVLGVAALALVARPGTAR